MGMRSAFHHSLPDLLRPGVSSLYIILIKIIEARAWEWGGRSQLLLGGHPSFQLREPLLSLATLRVRPRHVRIIQVEAEDREGV